MNAKKSYGKVYGISLNAAEKKAMNMEIQKQIAEYDRLHSAELEAMILWILHSEFGFGSVRLRRFHDKFVESIEDLAARCELNDCDLVWFCSEKLKEYGVDIGAWNSEEK